MAESALEKLLRLADASLLEPAALGKVDKSDDEPDEDEVHDYLMRECDWYKRVSEERCCSDPDEHCKSDGGGALIKFTPRTPEASTVDQPTVPPGGPGLFHVKGLHLPPYIQHLYPHLVGRYGKQKAYGVAVGIVKKWAAGVNPGGYKTKSGKGKRTHPDVKAAAGKNIAQWEADRAKAHAQSAKSAAEHVKAAAAVISAPGAGKPQPLAYGQLKQEPAPTVAPSSPLPPKVDLPTPKELRAFAAEIKKMTDDDDHHLVAVQMHLESAAEKMATNPVNALMSLRSAQTAIQQAWRFRVQRAQPRIAYVFSANTPPAEQSSQQQVRAQEQARIGEMQGAASKITVFISRVRKAYFSRMGLENETAGGGLAGQPNARL